MIKGSFFCVSAGQLHLLVMVSKTGAAQFYNRFRLFEEMVFGDGSTL